MYALPPRRSAILRSAASSRAKGAAVAEKDKKGAYDGAPGTDTSHQGPNDPSGTVSTQATVNLLYEILQELQQRVAATTPPPTDVPAQTAADRAAQLGAAGFAVIDNGVALLASIDVASVSPTQGRVGTPVTIRGANFLPGATATFGTSPAADVVVISTTEIRTTAPDIGGRGPVDVTVSSFGGEAVASAGFTYTP